MSQENAKDSIYIRTPDAYENEIVMCQLTKLTLL